MRSFVIHWDGKLLPDLFGRQKVDRIAILASYGGTSKFLGAPKVPAGSGENIAEVVHNALIKWDIVNRVSAMGFDTTTSNTGEHVGACILLQNKLDRKLIKFACRHHMYEIVLKYVFEVKHSVTSEPEVPIFNRFAAVWGNLDHKSFKSGLEDPIVRSKISDADCEAIKNFCNQELQKTQVRADYEELLQLTKTFLGEDGGSFRPCGPTSHARFMGKGIYAFKIYLFREQFALTVQESNGLRDICIFLVRLYVKAWFTCTNAIRAPNQDLNFLKDSSAYTSTDPKVAKAVLFKWKNHLWYLAPETVALAFFDSDVSLEEKRNMVGRLQSTEPIIKLKDDRIISDPRLLLDKNLSDFVSYKTKNFFDAFGLASDFLHQDPSVWETNEDYQDALDVCRDLFVVNDTAERGVKFMSDYNRVLTKDEEQNQFILQCIDEYRREYPSHNKSDLISN